MPRVGLKAKLIALVISVGTIPLVLAMVLSYFQGNKSLINVIESSFKALAQESGAKIDFLIKGEITKNARLTNHPTLILAIKQQNNRLENIPEPEIASHFAERSRLWAEKDPQTQSFQANLASRILKTFLREKNQSNLATASLYLTDAKGVLVASTNYYPDLVYANHTPQKIFQDRQVPVYIGELQYSEKAEEYIFEMVIPIKTHAGEIIGLFHRVYEAKNFFSPTIESTVFGETGHVMVITSDGVVIDCPILPTGTQLDDPILVSSVTKPEANWAKTQGDGHGSKDMSIIGFSPAPETSQITLASTNKRWFTFAWQSSEELFAPTKKFLQWISVAGFISILLIAIMGSLAADKFVQPIRELQKTAVAIGRGEQVEPLKITTGDEIELLANDINAMKTMLDQAFSGLEDLVQAKTQEVIFLKEYTENILMSVPNVLIVFNEKYQIELVNPAFEEIIGATGAQVKGKTLIDANLQYPEKWKDLADQLLVYAKGGSPSPATANSEEYKGGDPLAPSSGRGSQDSLPTINHGDYILTYQFFDITVKGQNLRHIGLIMKDITEEKKLLDKLVLADKLSGLGTLAAGIAHEMNNPLFAIMGYSETIVDGSDYSKAKNYAQKILERSKHMASVIKNISGYTRSNAEDIPSDVNINDLLDFSLEMAVLQSYTDNIEVIKNYSSLPPLKMKPEETQQIFLNVLSNAVQAMNGKGKIFLTSSHVDSEVVVEIRDTGPGIPSEYLAKVFDQSSTTEKQGEGTGLGLNIIHGLVEKYGGRITVDSKLGEGATFTISLPVTYTPERETNPMTGFNREEQI